MDMDHVRPLLLMWTLLNYGLLMVWFGTLVFAKPWLKRLHGRWFSLSDSQFDAVHYLCLALYKSVVMLFGLTPWLVLTWWGQPP